MTLETLEMPPAACEAPAATIPLDRACVLVRAPLNAVLDALAPFVRRGVAVDATAALERGLGLDALLPSFSRALGNRALAYKRRGAPWTAILREGDAREAHDVPLARRLSRVLAAPAVALHVAAADVALELFHEGRSIEGWLCVSGDVVSAQSAFELDEAALARDPYGRALEVLRAYGLEDDRLVFDDFARGDVVLRRWDVTLARCFAFADLAPWPEEGLAA